MKKHAHVLIAAVLLVAACSKQYDSDFDPTVEHAAYTTEHPLVTFDAGHHNRHSIKSSYRPFAELLRHDGYRVEESRGIIAPPILRGVRVLAIVTAMGEDEKNETAAFSEAECAAIQQWVARGGSLLLVTDHYPFGQAVTSLARRFGVEMAGGMTFDERNYDESSRDDSQLVFSRENGLLAKHPINDGVSRVVTFTGQSIRGGAPLLRLSDSAVHRAAHPRVERRGGDVLVNVEYGPPQPASGWAQAVAVQHGAGRVVVTGEAAMLTAQRDGDRRIGMNLPGVDNKRWILNVLHWLSRR